MEQIKLTATLACWVSTEYSLRGFTDAVAKGNHMAALDCVHFYGPPEREKFSDSTKVGTAEITMTVELARILEKHGAQSGMYLSEVRALRAEAERLAAQAAPTDYEAHQKNGLAWAVDCWAQEVKNRPLINAHRRTLDDTWRQVIRYFGGDPEKLIGPSHDALMSKGE